MSKLFAISDHHFGHQNIIKYCNRDDKTALEDAKSMILAHNSVVGKEDLVIFGGDVSASKQGRGWLPKIIPKLNGRKILIRGNHDHFKAEEYIQMGFESIHDVLVIGRYCFCHYPDILQVVDLCERNGYILCCGHTHKPFGEYPDKLQRINLCVDVQGKIPLLLGDLEDIQQYKPPINKEFDF